MVPYGIRLLDFEIGPRAPVLKSFGGVVNRATSIMLKGCGRITQSITLHRRQKDVAQHTWEKKANSYPYPKLVLREGKREVLVFRETDTGKLQPLPEVPGKGKEKVVIRSKAQDEGQAGPDPGKLDEGQAGPNPDEVAESQPLPTPSVLAGPNLEHSDVEITDASSQPQPEHMDEGFIATAYPEVQENLKLSVDEQMIPEEPVSSTGTLSSLQHLTKDFSYGDQFIDDKPSEANNEKTTADTEAESMVSVTIQQDTSVIPPMTSPVIGPVPRPDSPNVHWPLPTTTTTTSATTTTLPLPPQPQQGLSGSDTDSDEATPPVIRSKAQDEGQAGPDPGKLDEVQAGPNPDKVAESQPLPTPSVLVGQNLEHSDVEIIDASSQPQPEHMDEGFIATAYPEVQENLKLSVDEQMIPEEPVSSTGMLSSLQHLTKDFSYGD
ncbi:hypothetical protein Tco_0686575 [Tanacetum coccineum]